MSSSGFLSICAREDCEMRKCRSSVRLSAPPPILFLPSSHARTPSLRPFPDVSRAAENHSSTAWLWKARPRGMVIQINQSSAVPTDTRTNSPTHTRTLAQCVSNNRLIVSYTPQGDSWSTPWGLNTVTQPTALNSVTRFIDQKYHNQQNTLILECAIFKKSMFSLSEMPEKTFMRC